MFILAREGDPGGWPGWWVALVLFTAATVALCTVLAVAFWRRRAMLSAARSVVADDRVTSIGPVRRLRALPRMLAATWRGRYSELTRARTLVWLVGLAYLVSPVDLLPELLPLLGITDDAGVGVWLASSVYLEAGHYLATGESADRGSEGRSSSGGGSSGATESNESHR